MADPTDKQPIIVVEGVSRRFLPGGSEVWALRDVSMTVTEGSIAALVGRSGSGKTTLLNLIAGLDRPTSGTIVVDGKDMNRLSDRERTLHRRNTIGFIFQSFGLLPLLSAEENVELALRISGAGPRERGRRAQEVLDLVGLGQRRRHRPYELSGGEQQRVSIARAISTRPRLVIADEPTAELDSTTALQIFGLLRDIAKIEGATVVTTTHDPMLIEHVDEVVELQDGQVVGAGTESDLLSFGQARRREADVALAPSHGSFLAGQSLDAEAFRLRPEEQRRREERSAPREAPPEADNDSARWAPPHERR